MTRVVGLGASAGGLEPLAQFLAHVPPGSGLAYVVVQHLDPEHKAMLSELLQRVTPMPVCEATEAMLVRPDAVYVIPPNRELTVSGNILHLREPVKPRGMRLPIDALFSSLARDQGDQAIGVVLSGMGSDGTLGLLAIKGQGGLALAQSPASAQFDSMPSSAIASGCVDIVAAPAELPLRIGLLAEPQFDVDGGARTAAGPSADVMKSLDSILVLLREHSKHDLTLYKSSTLLRRIERRMAVHGLGTVGSYESFLRQNPLELDLMFREMLIGVTAFFRDTAVWQELHDKVLPGLLERRAGGVPLRAWVVGCSTGEEAYSLAIVIQELTAAMPEADRPRLQVFASDLSADAIEFARKGQYSLEIAKDVEPERLGRFFVAHAGHFAIQKSVREMILFAQHDVILDPPFTRLDIICCRNLLIYFNATLQRRLLPLFHYCLRPGGVLVLGGSETVGPSQNLFTATNSKLRLYRRIDLDMNIRAVDFPVNLRAWPRAREQESNLAKSTNLQSLADHVILNEFSPPAVLVNEHGDIIYINGRTGRYLEPAAGKANWNIHVMARPGIRTQLAVALRQVLQDHKPIELRGLKVEDGGGKQVDVTLQAFREPNALNGMVLIVFRDTADQVAAKSARRRRAGPNDPATNQELERSLEEIRALRQETRASQEELQATNEELQSTNEELQSANEELTTSKEEAQSMNEELQTVNSELRLKLDDLALAQSDMQNLLNSTDIATLFLDNNLNVRRFTERATRVFHLRDGDIGRPLSDLASTLTYPDLGVDARETLRTLAVSEKEIATTDGKWYSARIMPYRTISNVIQGVVITLVDITTAKHLESSLRK
jgi:two-component system, chemotaxis family, CheB/CheR fusion protein